MNETHAKSEISPEILRQDRRTLRGTELNPAEVMILLRQRAARENASHVNCLILIPQIG
jgi:hypothetical protein